MRRKNSGQEGDFQLDLTKDAPMVKRDSLGLPISDPLEYSDDDSCNEIILKEIQDQERLEEELRIGQMKESMHSQQSSRSSASRCTVNSEDRKRERRAIFQKYKKPQSPVGKPQQAEKDLLLAFDTIFKKKENFATKKTCLEEERIPQTNLKANQQKVDKVTAPPHFAVQNVVAMDVSDNSLIVMDGNNEDQLADTVKQLPQSSLKSSSQSNGVYQSIALKHRDSAASDGNKLPQSLSGEMNLPGRALSKIMKEDSLLGGNNFSKIYPIERNTSIISARESNDLEDLLKEDIFNDMSQLDVNKSNLLTGSLQLKDSFRLIHASAIKEQNEPQADPKDTQNQNPNFPIIVEAKMQPFPTSSDSLPMVSPTKSYTSADSNSQKTVGVTKATSSTTLAQVHLVQPPGLELVTSPFPQTPDLCGVAAPIKNSPTQVRDGTLVTKVDPFAVRVISTNSNQSKEAIQSNQVPSPIRTPISRMQDLMGSPTPISHRANEVLLPASFTKPQESPPELLEALPQSTIPELLREAFRLNSTSLNPKYPNIHLLAPKLKTQLTQLVKQLSAATSTLSILNEELLRRQTTQLDLRNNFTSEAFMQGQWAVPLSKNINLIKPSQPFVRRACDHIKIQSKLQETQNILPQLQAIINDGTKLDLKSAQSKNTYIAVRCSLNEILKNNLMVSEDLFIKAFAMYLPDHYIVFYQYLKTQVFSNTTANLKYAIRQKEALRVLVDFMRETGDPLCCSTVGRDIRLKLEGELVRLKRDYYQKKPHNTLA